MKDSTPSNCYAIGHAYASFRDLYRLFMRIISDIACETSVLLGKNGKVNVLILIDQILDITVLQMLVKINEL